MTNNEAKKFFDTISRDIWAAKDLSKFDKFYRKDVQLVAYLPGEELEFDYESLTVFVHNNAKTRYKVDTTFEEIIGQKNTLIAKFRQSSVNRITNQVMHCRIVIGYELKDGKIYRGWAISNRVWTF